MRKHVLQNIGYYFKLPPRMCTPHLVMEPVMGVYYGPHYKMGVAHNMEFGYISGTIENRILIQAFQILLDLKKNLPGSTALLKRNIFCYNVILTYS